MNYKGTKRLCDCIIPFHNEGLRPVSVVQTLIESRLFSKIIAVDDGSEDSSTYRKLKKQFPNIITIRLPHNSGKAHAIKEGLQYAISDYVLLMDGDLTNIKEKEIENAIIKISNDQTIDMIIFRRMVDKTVIISRFIRHDIIFSGQRVLRRSDLEQVMDNEIIGYNLESAINRYMIKHHKNVYWMPLSVHNLFKHEKWGYSQGLLKIGIPAFIGFMCSPDIVYQTLFFCRNEASKDTMQLDNMYI